MYGVYLCAFLSTDDIITIYLQTLWLASPEEIKKQPNIGEDGRYSPDGASIAYISETLITQITKEPRLDMIKTLTIHLPKDKLNKTIKANINRKYNLYSSS